MEEGAVLVKEAEKKIPMKIEDRKLYIGDMPQLIVDLETQENYIRTEERLISYKKRIELSPDLLAGKTGKCPADCAGILLHAGV